jgi:LacI family transcriptional regulator
MIMATAKQLGYVYSVSVMKKARGRTKNIMLIGSEIAFSQKSFFGEIYLAVEREVSKNGLNLLIQSINREAKENLILPQAVQSQAVDGILILSHISNPYINAIIATGIPTVLVDHHDPKIFADCILINNRFGAYGAVQHLIELGHSEIGFIGNIAGSPSYYERFEGYLMALNYNNIAVDTEITLKDTTEQGDDIFELLKQLNKMPTAWFCVNDGIGFLVNSSLKQLGIKIPQSVSVCSFDNGQLSQIATPGITSIEIDLELYGRKAVEQLLWRIENKDEPFMEILLPTCLIPRESTMICAASHEQQSGHY